MPGIKPAERMSNRQQPISTKTGIVAVTCYFISITFKQKLP